MKKQRIVAIACVMIIMPIIATSAMAENILRWTSQGDALTLDPHAQNEGPTIATNGRIYETLVTRNAQLELEPELATSWNADGDVWTFNLRKDVTFHNGARFSAEDVIFSFNRAEAETSDFKEQVETIKSITAIDDYTVQIKTEGPNPILPNQLTSLFIMDKDWAEDNNVVTPQNYADKEENYAVRNTNGTGPFMLETREPDELTILIANPNWWGKGMFPGNIDKIVYRPITNAATRIAALLSGEVDFVLDPPLQDLKRIDATEGLNVLTVPQIRSIFLGMDQKIDVLRTSDIKGKNPFKDLSVRQAFNLAVDKKAIQRVVMEGLSFPTSMITSPGVLGNTSELDASYGHDLVKAKKLMADAGYSDGFSVQLDCPNNRYINDEKICQAVVSMLARIGVKVKLDAIPKAQHFPKIQKRTSDFYMLGLGVPTLDSHYVFSYLLETNGSWNASGYSNPRVDEITAIIATQTDIDKRAELIDEAWTIVRNEYPYLPIHHQVIAWGVSDKFDIPISADDNFRPRYAVKK